MSKFTIIMKYGQLAMAALFTVMEKLADGVLTPIEIVEGVESIAKTAMPDIDSSKFNRLMAITSEDELESGYTYKPGDILFVIPAELIDDFKIDLT